MRIAHDPQLCQAHAMCLISDPERFEMAQLAVSTCPQQALRLIEPVALFS